MLRKIYKYEIPFSESGFHLNGHGIIKIVDVKISDNLQAFTIWAEVVSDIQRQTSFFTIGTGWGIPIGSKHVGSIHVSSYVWHLYVAEQDLIDPKMLGRLM